MIFLCYAKEDKAAVDQVYVELARRELHPWMDKPPAPYSQLGIPPGVDWDSYIRTKISEAQICLAFLSNTSVKKRGYVQREYRLAIDMMGQMPSDQVYLVPVLLEDCEVPDIRVDSKSFRSLQWYEFFQHGIDGLVALLSGQWGQTPGPRQRNLERELLLAGEILQSVTRQTEVQIPGYSSARRADSSLEVGGDFVDIFTIDSTKHCAVIADTSGRGLPAALVAVHLHASIKALLKAHLPLADCLPSVNQLWLEQYPSHVFATCFVAVLDVAAHTLEYVNAGHGHSYQVLATGERRDLNPAGMPLGVFSGVSWDVGTTAIGYGDVILSATDGVTEAEIERGNEYFGEERLLQIVTKRVGDTAPAILSEIFALVEAFEPVPKDDRAAFILKRIA